MIAPSSPASQPKAAEQAPVTSQREREPARLPDDAPLLDRVAEACAQRRMLLTIVTNAKIVSQENDCVILGFSPANRAAAEAHLAELKPYFARVMGQRDIEVVIEKPDEQSASGSAEASVPRTRVDVDLDHPLIRQVSELFDATPKRVDLRNEGARDV